jgi:two pore calcium channel protein 1
MCSASCFPLHPSRSIATGIAKVYYVLFLLLMFIMISAIIGFFLFSTNNKDPNFLTFPRSLRSMFVLMTTANYPDVMLPA